MAIYKMSTDYDKTGNSPWDAIWYEGDNDDLQSLRCQMRLQGIWNSPIIRCQNRLKRPEIYGFQLHFAFSQKAFEALTPLLGNTVELLPLTEPNGLKLYCLHPLHCVDLDGNAATNRMGPTDSMTRIDKYSFKQDAFTDDMHLVRILHPPGSSQRDAGWVFGDHLVTERFKIICENNSLNGVSFERVWN